MESKNGHQDYLRERRLLESKLGTAFKEATWKRVETLVGEYHSEQMLWEDVEGYAREMLEYQHELQQEEGYRRTDAEQPPANTGSEAGPSAEPSTAFFVELPERDQKRADVLLEIEMRQAAERSDVQRFRHERLGSRLLSAEQVEREYYRPGARDTIDEGLARLGRSLGENYNWSQGDAEWFVLTGEPPTLHPLGVSCRMHGSIYGPSYGEITLHAAPWVPAEKVKQAFLRMRTQLRDGQASGAVSEQRLEVLRFVEAARARPGEWPGFPSLLEEFNEAHPQWAYPGYRSFAKAYRESRCEVLYPEYHSPRRKSTPNMERQEARIEAGFRSLAEALQKRKDRIVSRQNS